MTLKVYVDLMSQPCRSLIIFLRMNSIAHTEVPVALRKGEHFEDEYTKVHPFKKVPAIDDNGFKLIESATIMRYLADKNLPETQRHWYPTGKLRAKVDEYLDWHHLNTRFNCSMYFQTKLIRPLVTQKAADLKKVEQSRRGIDKVIQDIGSYFLQDRKFFLGEQISIADLHAACEIEQPLADGIDPFQNQQQASEWLERVRQTTQPHYKDATKYLYPTAKRIKEMLASQNLSGDAKQ